MLVLSSVYAGCCIYWLLRVGCCVDWQMCMLEVMNVGMCGVYCVCWLLCVLVVEYTGCCVYGLVSMLLSVYGEYDVCWW